MAIAAISASMELRRYAATLRESAAECRNAEVRTGPVNSGDLTYQAEIFVPQAWTANGRVINEFSTADTPNPNLPHDRLRGPLCGLLALLECVRQWFIFFTWTFSGTSKFEDDWNQHLEHTPSPSSTPNKMNPFTNNLQLARSRLLGPVGFAVVVFIENCLSSLC